MKRFLVTLGSIFLSLYSISLPTPFGLLFLDALFLLIFMWLAIWQNTLAIVSLISVVITLEVIGLFHHGIVTLLAVIIYGIYQLLLHRLQATSLLPRIVLGLALVSICYNVLLFSRTGFIQRIPLLIPVFIVFSLISALFISGKNRVSHEHV